MNAKHARLTHCFAAPSIVVAVFGFVLNSDAIAGNIIYEVVPYTISDPDFGEYHITGTIRTDGTIATGPNWLQPENILDYEINVDGAYPFVFSPSNPASGVDIEYSFDDGIGATATEIYFAAHGDHFLRLTFSSKDNSLPQCSDCSQAIWWESVTAVGTGHSAIWYRFNDSFDGDPGVDFPYVLNLRTIARVPEPSTLLLCGLAFSAVIVARAAGG